jgi:hypothetical protein
MYWRAGIGMLNRLLATRPGGVCTQGLTADPVLRRANEALQPRAVVTY